MVLDESLKQSHNKFGVLTDDLNISWGFYSYGSVLIAAFVKAHYYLFLHVIANGELAFTSISLSFLVALYELIQPQLFQFFPLL